MTTSQRRPHIGALILDAALAAEAAAAVVSILHRPAVDSNTPSTLSAVSGQVM